jgi:V/A-type H+/Na+-transporting ATPase subunit E
MEIIKSSEKLEKQLLDDARKKAERILKNADKDCDKILKEEISKAEEEISNLEKDEKLKLDKLENEIKAVLPLDIMRKRLAFIDSVMNSALNDFFSEITEKDLNDILSVSAMKVKDIFSGKEIVVSYNGISEKKIKEIISKSVTGVTVKKLKEDAPEAGFILETTDKKVTYNSTVKHLKSYLLENYRGELLKELFAENF